MYKRQIQGLGNARQQGSAPEFDLDVDAFGDEFGSNGGDSYTRQKLGGGSEGKGKHGVSPDQLKGQQRRAAGVSKMI